MTPVTFFELPIEQQIARATAAAQQAVTLYDFPDGVTLDLLKHRENTVFAVIAPGGRKLGALRVHAPVYQTEASILSEFQWMQALDEVGVRTPGVVAARNGALVVSVEIPELPEPRLCDVLEWIEGRPPGDEDILHSFHTLGELHARCHNHASHWPLPAGFTRQRWDDTTLLAGAHHTVAPAWDNWALSAEQRELILRCRDALRERLARWGKDRERYGIIHSDLMPENLILTDDGVRLIDFDDAGFGWYLYDPASALLYYYGTDLYETLLQSWLSGYRSERQLSDEDLAEMPTFLLLRCFYALGWLHARRNSDTAAAFIAPVVMWSTEIATRFLAGEGTNR